MYQLLVLIPISVDINSFDKYWPSFLETAEKMPGLIKESISSIDKCLYGQNQIRRIYSFSFKDKSSFEKALLSSAGEKAGDILHEITAGMVILLSGSYQEDSLDRIKSLSSTIE